MRKTMFGALLLAWMPALAASQDCKLKFAVVYTDGKELQIGLTAEQKKFWDREGAKHFKGMCLEAKEPNYIILWSEGLSGTEISKAAIDGLNRVKSTGQVATTVDTNSSPMSRTIYVSPSHQVRATADYWILDTSNSPFGVVRKGEGHQDVPSSRATSPGERVSASDVASTIADPVAAMENALKWLRKEKKL